jgi:hypothetical protein
VKDVLYWEERRIIVDDEGRTEIEYVQPKSDLPWFGPTTHQERIQRAIETIRRLYGKDAVNG